MKNFLFIPDLHNFSSDLWLNFFCKFWRVRIYFQAGLRDYCKTLNFFYSIFFSPIFDFVNFLTLHFQVKKILFVERAFEKALDTPLTSASVPVNWAFCRLYGVTTANISFIIFASFFPLSVYPVSVSSICRLNMYP